MHILLFIISIIIAYKWGDWRNWEKYYPTMLYFGFLDLVHNSIYYNMPLWMHVCTLGLKIPHTILNLLWILIVYTATVLVYIYHFPKMLKNQIVYISLWVLGYGVMEWILYLAKGIEYHNDWSIWASILFNYGMFTILWLHYKKPVIAWVFTLFMILIFVSVYQIPFELIK